MSPVPTPSWDLAHDIQVHTAKLARRGCFRNDLYVVLALAMDVQQHLPITLDLASPSELEAHMLGWAASDAAPSLWTESLGTGGKSYFKSVRDVSIQGSASVTQNCRHQFADGREVCQVPFQRLDAIGTNVIFVKIKPLDGCELGYIGTQRLHTTVTK